MHRTRLFLASATVSALGASLSLAASPQSAADATNQLGIDLFQQRAREKGNLCLSPYSIESALAMTFAGAAGQTREEMAHVLHLENQEAATVADSFSALNDSLARMAAATKNAASSKGQKKSDPITLEIANRIFTQKDEAFRQNFLSLVKTKFDAPLQPLDFKGDPGRAVDMINDWVAVQTHQRITHLIPSDGLDETTRMVLTNALYLKAPWETPFEKEATRAEPFHVDGNAGVDVPTMHLQSRGISYAANADYEAISLPYRGGDLRFVVLLPRAKNGLSNLEKKLTSAMLAECTHLPAANVILALPKFKIEPPTMPLQSDLRALGMKTAFDDPRGSANFDGIALRRPNDYLYISNVFHKTFIDVNEEGTEAAAATAVAIARLTSALNPDEPIEVKVDRPFLYAVQQASTGICLFLGRVTDPR